MRVLVFGAGGHIGSAVSEKLYGRGHDVEALTKSDYNVITDRSSVARHLLLDVAIYCVGYCPPGGFLNEIKYPLSQYPPGGFDKEIERHVIGPFNVFQEFLPVMRASGCFIFMSSAATRLLQMPRDKRPPFLNIYHHLAVIAAGDALIEGMRMDPQTNARHIKIHKIMPPAIRDSPFHEGGPELPVTVTTEQVVDAIVGCLSAKDHMDVFMVPSPK